MDEIWRPVEIYNMKNADGTWKYEVSNKGRVRRTPFLRYDNKQRGYRILIPQVSGSGYYKVNLSEHGTVHSVRVHILVATAFVPNPDKLVEVKHRDGDFSNNCSDNLVWTLRVRKRAEPKEKKQSKVCRAVRQYSLNGEFIAEYASTVEAWDICRIAEETIRLCCSRRNMTAAGYVWRYENDDEYAANPAVQMLIESRGRTTPSEEPEVWRPVTVFNTQLPGGRYKYDVSSFGNIRSFDPENIRFIIPKQQVSKKGSKQVTLRDDSGVAQTFSVAEIVALAFVDKPDGKNYIRHKDGNTLNNRASNLEWY